MNKYILAIDQGTTSSKAILYDDQYQVVAIHQLDITQYYPQEGWVEHDPIEIWSTQLECCQEVIRQAKIETNQIVSIGITNQRETIVAWDKETSQPIMNAIVWQDRRTAVECNQDEDILSSVKNKTKTGLNLDAYFSAPKIRWIWNHHSISRELFEKNRLAIGTIDTWILWKLTDGKAFKTDVSNASRTNLWNIYQNQWDEDLLAHYQIPKAILPAVCDSHHPYGSTDLFGTNIPIRAILGDQQAALYGHQATQVGMTKSTFGTGAFLLQNTGERCEASTSKLINTIAWRINQKTTYAIEGSVFNAGSALKWLKENMQLISSYDEIESICLETKDTDGVYMIPAFTGLGAPHWDMYARGTIIGIQRSTTKNHIIRATIESLAFQTKDVVFAIQNDSNIPLPELRIDGGVSHSNFLCQFLADILQIPILRSHSRECTALGIAMMAGLSKKIDSSETQSEDHEQFLPIMSPSQSDLCYEKWKTAVERSKNWVK